MTYVAWAVLYEGDTDEPYFNILIPRLMEDLALTGARSPNIPTLPAIRLRRAGPAEAANEACASSDAFHLIFIHADFGGRGLAARMRQRSSAYCEAMRRVCDWPADRCIVIAPRHETEAWVIADAAAVTGALGYTGTPESLGLPATASGAERIVDPKRTLRQAIARVRGRRRPLDPARVFTAIAQRQDLRKLRQSASFRIFENAVRNALDGLGCL